MRTNKPFFFCLLITVFIQLRGYTQTNPPMFKDPDFIKTVLQHHNAFRSELNLPPLTWSASLAQDALVWAKHLAAIDKGEHDQQVRGKEGENLWWGTASAFSYGDMVDTWGNEKKGFVYGVFPNVKATRNAMVGHYTQMVWRNTTSVGCAVVSNGNMDYMVCRYSPFGNIEGEKPY